MTLNVLFGNNPNASLNARRPFLHSNSNNNDDDIINNNHSFQSVEVESNADHNDNVNVDNNAVHSVDGNNNGNNDNDKKMIKSGGLGVLDFFFGFMLEDPLRQDQEDRDDEILRHHTDEAAVSNWNPLNTALFVAYALTTAATSVPIILISSMTDTLIFERDDNANNYYDNSNYDNSNTNNNQESAAFAPRVTAYAVLGTACGKFLLSSMGDIFGARRTSVVCSILLACSLLVLSCCRTAKAAYRTCFLVEFTQSVQWPCIIVLLATHYREHGNTVYEGGIYVTSLASRFGVLLGIPLWSLLLRNTSSWRLVALAGAWASLIASSVVYLFVHDSPKHKNDPQNPIDPQLLAQYYATNQGRPNRQPPTLVARIINVASLALAVFQNNVAPSLLHVLKSPTFYMVALAHTGSSAVRTSERILATYYRDTSQNTLSENRAGGLVVFLSFGTIAGLMVAGGMYTRLGNSNSNNNSNNSTERQRKRLVTKLYISTIASCYILAFLAIPWVRNTLNAPSLVLIFQIMATFVMGFSIAVPLYQIPSLVGATFGADKGLYAGYTDGVAYALSSLVWRIVGNAVQSDNNGMDSGTIGWAYGWAAVALILIVSAILMLEFMEHYFVRPGARTAGGYETILFV